MVLASSGSGNFLIPNGTFVVELVIFLVVLGVMATVVLPPIQRAVDERHARIRADLAAAEQARAAAARAAAARRELLEAARAEARALVDAAARVAEEARAAGRAEGERRYAELLAAARAEIEEARRAAERESLEALPALVASAASRVLGSPVDVTTHRERIDAAARRLGAGV